MKTTFTWTQMAGLHGTSDIDALDYEIPSDVDAVAFLSDDLRSSLAGAFETKDVLLARHLGFEISHEGITFTDNSLRLAHVIDFGVAVSAIDDGDVIVGSLGHVLGFVDGKEIRKSCTVLRAAVDLSYAMRGEPTGEGIERVTDAELTVIISQASDWMPAVLLRAA